MPKPINILSFGFKNGAPLGLPAAAIIDCRDLPNPHSVDSLRNLDGRDPRVAAHVRMGTRFRLKMDKAREMASPGATIAFGCHGGRHRSVALAEQLRKELLANGVPTILQHREL